MKWFKHDADAFLSEGIDYLIDQEGFAGYGRWNRLLEIVAFKMDETNRCHVEYSIQKWCRLLGLKQKKLISFLELTKNQLKTKVVYSENIVRIEIPNLLKKRDNYTKNLQVTKKPLTTIEVEVEVEKEVEVKNNKKTSIPKDFSISERVKKWAKEKGHINLEAHWENFIIKSKSKNYKYVDWDSAFMGAIRDNWAKIESSNKSEYKYIGR